MTFWKRRIYILNLMDAMILDTVKVIQVMLMNMPQVIRHLLKIHLLIFSKNKSPRWQLALSQNYLLCLMIWFGSRLRLRRVG